MGFSLVVGVGVEVRRCTARRSRRAEAGAEHELEGDLVHVGGKGRVSLRSYGVVNVPGVRGLLKDRCRSPAVPSGRSISGIGC